MTWGPHPPRFAEALVAPALFGATFSGPSFSTWRTVAKVMDGLVLDEAERAIFEELTGRSPSIGVAPDEVWFVKGRRSGFSLFAAALGVHTAVFGSFSHRLAPGEVATVMLLAADKRQARVLMRYAEGFIDASPLLASLVTARTVESISLSTRATIEVHVSNFRAVRGYAIPLAICDELAFWEGDESAANPAAEVLAALRPALASLGGRLLCGSSPYARRGPLFDSYSKKFGKDDPRVLVVRGTTSQFNPTIDAAIIERALVEDEPRARAEWLAEFRTDVESFISREAVDAVVVPGRFELAPRPGVRYQAFTDPSGGSSDSMTLAIAHQEGGRVVLDLVRETKAPFVPSGVVEDFAAILKRYGLSLVTGDRYASMWNVEQWRLCGIQYRVADQDRSSLYLSLLPIINSGGCELLDVDRLRAQLVGLQRRTRLAGRDLVDHAPGGHEDVANAVAGALVLARTTVDAWLRLMQQQNDEVRLAVAHDNGTDDGVPRHLACRQRGDWTVIPESGQCSRCGTALTTPATT